MVAFYDFLAGKGTQRGVMNRAVGLEAMGGDLRPLHSPTFREACVSLWTDELDSARSTLTDIEKRCRDGGDEGSLAVILFMLALLECWAGAWSEAGLYADESGTITVWTGQQPYRALALSVKALVEAHRGQEQAARTAAEEGLELARQSGLKQAGQFNLSALGFLELSLGNAEATDRLLRPLAEGALDAGIGEPGMLRFLPDEIEALIALGEAERARSLLQPFLARSEELGRSWALAAAERARGLLAASAGRTPRGTRRVRPGVGASRRAGGALRARADAARTGPSPPPNEEVAARTGLARSVVGDVRAARRGSVGGQGTGRDREGRRSGSGSRRPDADGAKGRRPGGERTHQQGGRPRAVPERQHRRGEPAADLSEARRPVADRTVSEAGRAIGDVRASRRFVRCSETWAAPPIS